MKLAGEKEIYSLRRQNKKQGGQWIVLKHGKNIRRAKTETLALKIIADLQSKAEVGPADDAGIYA